MAEHVIMFAGPMGAGKTTAIRTLSDIEVVATEAINLDHSVSAKPTTTVALDYGEMTIGPGEKLRLYGVPGQKRFDFMWAILKQRAFGLVVLVNADAPNLTQDLADHLEAFRTVVERGGVVVGVTRIDVAGSSAMAQIQRTVARAFPDRSTPVFEVDARNAQHMQVLLMTLIADIEVRAAMKGTA